MTPLPCPAHRAPPPHIECPTCGLRSFHPKDIEHRYCGRCGFHDGSLRKTPAAPAPRGGP